MTILINASNLQQGGGIQVTQSICGQLKEHHEHRFVVVLSSYFDSVSIDVEKDVKVFKHNIKNTF